METRNEKREKGFYIAPDVVCLKLDNEISLILQSEPPIGPGESLGIFGAASTPNYFNNDPFKTNVG
jgi:hypothetical protein